MYMLFIANRRGFEPKFPKGGMVHLAMYSQGFAPDHECEQVWRQE
jgi:hypothetical protein